MNPSHRGARKSDGLRLSIIPEPSVDTAFPYPYFHSLPRKDISLESIFSSEEDEANNPQFAQSCKSQEALKHEIVDWLELNESDNNWAIRRRSHWKSVSL